MKCPDCGQELESAGYRRCPECGAHLPRRREYVYGRRSRLRLSTEIKFLLIVILVAGACLAACHLLHSWSPG